MAKGKNAAALFEVINRGRQQGARRPVTGTPGWWFKGKPTDGGASPSGNGAGAAADNDLHFELDRDRHVVSLRATFATAIITIFAVLVVIGIAFQIGTHVGKRAALNPAGDDEVKVTQATGAEGSAAGQQSGGANGQQATSPLVMVPVKPETQRQTQAAPQPTPQQPTRSAQGGAQQPRETAAPPRPVQQEQQTTPTRPREVPAESVQRQPGLNYMVMQSYPPDAEMRQAAIDAQAALSARGIRTTIEPAPAGFGKKGWISLVGTMGFEKVSGSEYDRYKAAVLDVSAKMKVQRFLKLEPVPVKWKG